MTRWTWVVLLGACALGCGGDDGETGTASGGTSAGGTSGSGGNASGGTGSNPSGGSGGVSGSGNLGGTAGSTAGGSGGVAGSGNLGGAAGGGGIGGALNDACYDMCDQQEKGENCVPELTKTCKQGCDLVTPGFETKCPEVAKAYYDCGASIEYVCFLGLPSAKDKNACKSENAAMDACN